MDSFLNTLDRLSRMINSRLRPGVSKVWVQGVSASNASLVFTIFYRDMTQTPLNCGYVMRFLEVKNFRHYRHDGDIENEERLLENYITQFRRVLDDIIE
jgi:hypothetical protein